MTLTDDATHLSEPSQLDMNALDNLNRKGPKSGIQLSRSQAELVMSRVALNSTICSYYVSARGYNNRLYYVTTFTPDGTTEEYIIKVCGRYWHQRKTETEVVGIWLANEYARVPTPSICEWDSNGQEFGVEYTVMPRLPGASLDMVWKELKPEVRKNLLKQLATMVITIKTQALEHVLQPHKIGNWVITEADHEQTKWRTVKNFEIGPSLDEIGPWNTYKCYLRAQLERQLSVARGQPILQDMAGVWARVERLLVGLAHDKTITNDSNFVFTHGDLDAQNILVEESISTDGMLSITAILDWEWSGIFPAEEEYLASYSFIYADKTDTELFYNLLEEGGVATPRTIAYFKQREHLYNLRENIAPWFLLDLHDAKSEGLKEQVLGAQLVAEQALEYLGY